MDLNLKLTFKFGLNFFTKAQNSTIFRSSTSSGRLIITVHSIKG